MRGKINIAVCDDDEIYRVKVKELCSNCLNEYGIEADFDLYEDGKNLCEQASLIEKYHIFFLDINMKKMNGIETVRFIRKINKDAFIVLVTFYMDYVLEGYKIQAVRYLMKMNLDAENMRECMSFIIDKINICGMKVAFDFKEGSRKLSVNDIIYLESKGHNIFFHVFADSVQTFSIYEKLDHIEKVMSAAGFLRIHKSYLINMKYIDKVVNQRICLDDGIELPISKSRYREVKSAFLDYIHG